MEATYAQALLNVISSGVSEADAVKNLVRHLSEVGRTKLLPGITRELRRLQARHVKLAPSIEVASEAEKASAIEEATRMGITGAHAKVNHSLIKGWRALSKGTLVDRSAKRMLTDIYQNVVAGT